VTLSTLLPFLGYMLFISYENEHARRFQGASQTFHMLLIYSVILGWITGLVYMFFLGFQISWWSPFAYIGIGILSFILIVPFDHVLRLPCALIGFAGWPICAYFMFKGI